MANALFESGRNGFLSGLIDWDTDTLKGMLADLNTSDTAVKQITGVTNASPPVVTSTAHGFSNGDVISITGVLGAVGANGLRKIKNVAANTFELTDTSDVNIGAPGAYTSGGVVVNLTLGVFLQDVDACRVGTDAAIVGTAVAGGIAGATAATVWTSVSGATVEAVIIYKDTANAATSRLICLIDTATGLPLTPGGGSVTATWLTTGNKIFKL